MSSFRTRRIRRTNSAVLVSKYKKGALNMGCRFLCCLWQKKRYWVSFALILIATSIVFRVTMAAYRWVIDFDPKDIVFAVAKELKQDENGYVNMVLLGDGGHVRDGADLIDTIMVVSLDLEHNQASLLSIPRDFYVRHPVYGNAKINELYRDNKNAMGEEGAFDVYPEVIGDIVGLDIPYYLRIDFNAFVEVVDNLGGIEVEVQNAIYDPYYPNETDNGYTVFQIDAGTQYLNGETALKFVRSRKTTSDFDRASRQQQVLMAIRGSALSKNVLGNPRVIKNLYQSVKNNINTNLTNREMIALAKFAKDFDRSHLVSKVIHDDPAREGGFLYTPERKYYHGQFVLVPDGDNLDFIHRYADLIFHQREVLRSPINIEVLNATTRPGLARILASHLNRFGFNIVNIDNLFDRAGRRKNIEKSYIQYHRWQVDADGGIQPDHQAHIAALATFVKGEVIPTDEPAEEGEDIDMTIVLGADYEIY